MAKRNIPFQRQATVEIIYEGLVIDEGLKLDILVDDLIIIELKAQQLYHPVWEAQLLSYLKLTATIALKEIFARKNDLEKTKEFKARLETVDGGGKNKESFFKQ